MDKQFLAGKHGYDCDMAGDTITAWRDARPQPDWAALWADELTYREQIASYESAQSDGYTDQITGVKLKTTTKAQSAFTSLVTMIQEGLSLGAITNDTQQTIWDFNNQPVVLTTLQVRQLMFRYGLHCKSFFDDYAP